MAGSPRSVWTLRLRQWCCAAVLTLTAPFAASAAAPCDETSQEVRIRLEWSGDRPEIFAGVLETSQGTFASPLSLSPEADQAGTLWADRQNLWLRSRSPRRSGGFDVTLRASGTARIQFTLQFGDQNGRSRHFDWKLADVGREPIVFALGDRPGRLTVRRAPGDELRVSIARPHLIFGPGETFKAVLLPDTNGRTGDWSAATLEWESRFARTGLVVSRGSLPAPHWDQASTRPPIPIALSLPDREGAFDLRFRLKAKTGEALESVAQVLVLADESGRHANLANVDVAVDARRRERVVLASAAIPSVPQLVGPHLNTPDLNLVFGPPRDFAGLAREDAQNWDAFYTGARRAADDLRDHGDTCLILPVLADGSTIYPSAFVERSVRFDKGLRSGRDPMQKDIVELLYRVFDRSGLALIPELRFDCPLISLERQLAAGESATQGIELVGPDGQAARDSDESNSGLTPSYNPLDPRVQKAVLDVVREFVERYHHHASYRGVAIDIDRCCYLQLPGIEWGCDPATLDRFQRDTGVRMKGQPQLASELLNGDVRSKWIAWRCAEVAGFYRRMASAAASSAPQGRLMISCKPRTITASYIRLCSENSNPITDGNSMADQGLDFALLKRIPHLIVFRSSAKRSQLHDFDRTSRTEPVGEASVPVDNPAR
jgi:hypothetical protein